MYSISGASEHQNVIQYMIERLYFPHHFLKHLRTEICFSTKCVTTKNSKSIQNALQYTHRQAGDFCILCIRGSFETRTSTATTKLNKTRRKVAMQLLNKTTISRYILKNHSKRQ